MHDGARMALAQQVELPRERGRGARGDEDAQACAVPNLGELIGEVTLELPARRRLAQLARCFRSLRIPQLQHRRLAVHAGCAEARRMRRVALDLGRPAGVRLDEQAFGAADEARLERWRSRFEAIQRSIAEVAAPV